MSLEFNVKSCETFYPPRQRGIRYVHQSPAQEKEQESNAQAFLYAVLIIKDRHKASVTARSLEVKEQISCPGFSPILPLPCPPGAHPDAV